MINKRDDVPLLAGTGSAALTTRVPITRITAVITRRSTHDFVVISPPYQERAPGIRAGNTQAFIMMINIYHNNEYV